MVSGTTPPACSGGVGVGLGCAGPVVGRCGSKRGARREGIGAGGFGSGIFRVAERLYSRARLSS